jgi:hypothetical protein
LRCGWYKRHFNTPYGESYPRALRILSLNSTGADGISNVS